MAENPFKGLSKKVDADAPEDADVLENPFNGLSKRAEVADIEGNPFAGMGKKQVEQPERKSMQFARSFAASLPATPLRAGAGAAQATADFTDTLGGALSEIQIRRLRSSGESVPSEYVYKSNESEVSKEIRDTANTLRTAAADIAKDYGVDPEYAQTFMGQLSSAAGGMPTYMMAALGGTAGLPVLLGAGYEEAYNDYVNTVGEENVQSGEAFNYAAPYALASAALERIGIDNIVKRAIPKGKATWQQITKRLAGAGVGEGLTEAAQSFALDAIASIDVDPDREIFTEESLKEKFQAFLIGAILGAGTSGLIEGTRAMTGNAQATNVGEQVSAEMPVIDGNVSNELTIDKNADGTSSFEAPSDTKRNEPIRASQNIEVDQVENEGFTKIDEALRIEPVARERFVSAETISGVPIDERQMITDEQMGLLESEEGGIDFLTPIEKQSVRMDLKDEQAAQDLINEANSELSLIYNDVEGEVLTPAESQLLEYEFRDALNKRANTDKGLTPVSQIKARKDVLKAIAKGERTEVELNQKLSKARNKINEIVSRNSDRIMELKINFDQKLEQQKIKAGERLSNEVSRRVEEVKRRYSERKDVENAVKDLEKLVKQLPTSVRGKFTGFGTISTKVSQQAQQDFLNKSSERVLNLMDDYQVRRNQSSIDRLVKRITKNKKKAKELAPVDKIRRYGKLSRDDAENRAREILANEDLTPDMIEDAFMLRTFGGKLNPKETIGFTGQEMRMAREEAEYIAREGRSRAKERAIAESERINALRESAVTQILGDEDVKGLEVIKAKEESKSLVKRIADGINDFALTRNDGLEMLLDNLRIFGSRFEGFFQNNFFIPVFNAQMRVETNNRRDNTDFGNFIVDTILQSKQNTRSRRNLIKLMESWGVRTTEHKIAYKHDGKKQVLPLSKWQAISMWMQWQDQSLADTFEKMEIDQSVIDQVREFIGQEGESVGAYLMEYYKRTGTQVQQTVADVDNYILPIVENYSPVRRITDKAVEADSKGLTDMNTYTRSTEKNSSLIERVSNTNELIFDPANEVFTQHMYQMNHYLQFARIAKDIRSVFGSRKVKNAIRQRTGSEAYMRLLNEIFDDILRGGIDRAKFDKWANMITSNLAVSSLAFNLTSAVKQLASVPAYADGIPTDKFLRNIGSFWLNPIENSKTIIDTEYIQNRISNSFDRDLRNLAKQGTNKGIANVRTLQDKMMFLTRYGDLGAILQGGWAAYKYHYDKAIESGKTEEQASAIAEQKFALSTDRAQQSSQLFALGSWQRQGSFVKLFTMYLTTPIQYQRIINNAIKGYLTKDKTGNRRLTKRELAKTVFIYHVLLPQIFTAMGSAFIGLWTDDDEVVEKFWNRQKAALAVGNLNSIFMLGQVIQAVAAVTSDEDLSFMSDISLPVLDKFSTFVSGINNLSNPENSDEMVQGADQLINSILSLSGIPYAPMKNQINGVIDAFSGEHEQPELRFFGFSDYAIMTTKNK